MRIPASVLMAFAAAAIVASCSGLPAQLDSPALKSGWPDVGTPPPTIALQTQAH
jgi:hypothetical protein